MATLNLPDVFAEPRRLDGLFPRMLQVGGFCALAGFGAAALLFIIADDKTEARTELFFSYLAAFMFVLSLALGGLFFTMIHHVARVGWSTVVRRLAEGAAMTLPFLALFLVPILIPGWGMESLYHEWVHPESGAHASHVAPKEPYLNYPFFVVRMVISFAILGGLAFYFFRNSVAQDASGDEQISRRMQKMSAPGVILFALIITVLAVDLLMTLIPTWYSTIFGVYYFAGTFMSFFGFLIVFSVWLQRNDRLGKVITAEHYHDMGKFMFAFTVFWAYIAFSQYMLIWYANIPEETQFFRPYHDNPSWGAASWLLILGHFIIPFVGFMSRAIKRRKHLIAIWACWMMFMHWFDLFWLTGPRWSPERVPFGLMSITCLIGMVGVFIALTGYTLRSCSLVPERDPRLHDSLAFENF